MSGNPISALVREPLLQFLLLGAIIFAVDYYWVGRADDPRRIVIDDKKFNELVTIFEEGQGRKPTPGETEKLIVKWTQNEILYREALRMKLDQGDEMIRNRVILKLHNILFNNVSIEVPPEAELRSWFAEHRELYDRPAYFDFEQFSLSGVGTEAQALAVAATLDTVAGEKKGTLHRYRHRPATNLTSLYGAQHAGKLLGAAPNTWVAVEDSRGWQLARITASQPAQAAAFEQVHKRVIEDWKRYSHDLQLVRQTREIADRYTVVMQLSPELEKRAQPGDAAQAADAGSGPAADGDALVSAGALR